MLMYFPNSMSTALLFELCHS
ncbi:rCG31739 [Rattus norvegicus]|uniref:RCG31739 n=1 Tax=Rattus norvegicus TaxID=10116 RepID=A6JN63_RAT|nr:rCG31739 [Rattus norvegicus]